MEMLPAGKSIIYAIICRNCKKIELTYKAPPPPPYIRCMPCNRLAEIYAFDMPKPTKVVDAAEKAFDYLKAKINVNGTTTSVDNLTFDNVNTTSSGQDGKHRRIDGSSEGTTPADSKPRS